VGEQTEGEKLGLTVPVAAASQIVFSRERTAYNKNRAWAYKINQKLSPAPGIKLIFTKILKIVAFKGAIIKF
jgi:hypothetical protein